MNYIKHLTGFFEKVSTDFDLNPTHISLYMAIFQLWNQNRFQNPIGISRDELMRISKIASYATYHKCIRELDERDFVKYMPSYNPFKGSTLEVLNLDFYTKPIQKKEIKKLKTQQKIKQVNEQAIVQVDELGIEQVLNKHCTSTELLPYINNTNSINIVNGQAQKKQDKNDAFLLEKEPQPKKKLREKKGIEHGEKIPPIWEEVALYFKEKNNSEIEAQKFYNHFQSNGWLVGGKSKMKDWKAAARNWMLNTNNFQPKSNKPQPNHLHTTNSKNYAEPL
ncbi:transcriptional regulator [Flavobacterium soyangense]|uniref:Transcriptional regulator n=1 Tax=Flavobacterium soyangense TaxID=2023265 RepID=A0A930UDW9_9FLAO|nr:transcriptional regulator [Flavobacterium soyangense]MBF2709092.1 transcriptional regulator [Flavobacterium soyangense]